MLRRSRTAAPAVANPNLTPLLDVGLQLITVFMMLVHFGTRLEGPTKLGRLPVGGESPSWAWWCGGGVGEGGEGGGGGGGVLVRPGGGADDRHDRGDRRPCTAVAALPPHDPRGGLFPRRADARHGLPAPGL